MQARRPGAMETPLGSPGAPRNSVYSPTTFGFKQPWGVGSKAVLQACGRESLRRKGTGERVPPPPRPQPDITTWVTVRWPPASLTAGSALSPAKGGRGGGALKGGNPSAPCRVTGRSAPTHQRPQAALQTPPLPSESEARFTSPCISRGQVQSASSGDFQDRSLEAGAADPRSRKAGETPITSFRGW